jgi:hypothetical protein
MKIAASLRKLLIGLRRMFRDYWRDIKSSLRGKIENFDEAISEVLFHEIATLLSVAALLHGSKSVLNVIPAQAGIQHKARYIEILISKICCIYTYFFGFPPARE